jgi:dipeptidyl-peptidase-3
VCSRFTGLKLTRPKCFLEADDDFCKLEYNNEDLSDLTINLDRSKILTAGRKGEEIPYPESSGTIKSKSNLCEKAVSSFLQKIHIYKSTADVKAGSEFFLGMSNVGLEYWGTKVRDVVLKNKQPRKVFVQAVTAVDEATGTVTCKQYEPTPEGMIQSWADRKL